MAAETAELRAKTRRIKNHIAVRYLKLADRVDEKGEGDLSESEYTKYWELTREFARNVVPRSQEIVGEDGEPISIVFDKTFNATSNITSEAAGDNPVPIQI